MSPSIEKNLHIDRNMFGDVGDFHPHIPKTTSRPSSCALNSIESTLDFKQNKIHDLVLIIM